MGKKRFQQRRLSNRDQDSDVVPVSGDDELLQRINAAYNGRGYSPERTIKRILSTCHEHMKVLTRVTADRFLSHSKQFDLDAVLTKNNINPDDPQWVANVRHLTENIVILRGLVSIAEEIHAQLGHGELATEVWGIIKGPREQILLEAAKAEQAAAAAAQLQRFGPGQVGPATGAAAPQPTVNPSVGPTVGPQLPPTYP